MSTPDKDAILARRKRFIALALTSVVAVAPYSTACACLSVIDSGQQCADVDADGFEAEGLCNLATAIDCDDSDAAINPNASDDSTDGVDQDCDGTDGPGDSGS